MCLVLTYAECLFRDRHVLLPAGTDRVREVASKVEYTTAHGCQVGSREEDTDHEAEGDGGDAEDEEEEGDDERVGMFENASNLKQTPATNTCNT